MECEAMGESITRLLRRVDAEDVSAQAQDVVDARTLAEAREIVDAVRGGGEASVRGYAERFGERRAGEALVLERKEMEAALGRIDAEFLGVLERAARRIEWFARAQREAIGAVDVSVPGGRAGHTVEPVGAAGCYAPAGRYPLPSSVLMTAVTARVAGCGRVVVASPGAGDLQLAASAIAGADEYLAVGGAHAVAAMAYGFEGFGRVDVIAGPGNRWVTAAKQLVMGAVGIDMLAGPSELLVIADSSADARLVAADLLAQAEHDDDAVPVLVTDSGALADAVEVELAAQLEVLETRTTAARALRNGYACVVDDRDAMRAVADAVAAEHVEVMVEDAEAFAMSLRNAGALFVGSGSAEVLGDYGAGPNHTLPTGGTARFQAGLSVMSFLRLRTWLRIDDAAGARGLVDDAAALASMEGLAGHRASAEARRGDQSR
jgi:phosphoribosyl-ATP pyrophosphohydrolase/phosphoribosyl-AMP cyclohydrolase/histidinol dehydrogenase